MTAYLLDVNVLIALVDPTHEHHEAAHQWFSVRGQATWATCPLTENGLVRVLSNPNYPNRPGDAPAVLEFLRRLCASGGHRFWADDVSLHDAVQPGASFTHNQLTDIFLLALAAHHEGWLATFDTSVATAPVRNGASALEIVPAL